MWLSFVMIHLLSPLGVLCYRNATSGPFARNFNKFWFFILRSVPVFGQFRIQFGHRVGFMALAQVSIPHRHSKTGMAHQSGLPLPGRTGHKKVTGEAMAYVVNPEISSSASSRRGARLESAIWLCKPAPDTGQV
jgi:hypothetical protein